MEAINAEGATFFPGASGEQIVLSALTRACQNIVLNDLLVYQALFLYLYMSHNTASLRFLFAANPDLSTWDKERERERERL